MTESSIVMMRMHQADAMFSKR